MYIILYYYLWYFSELWWRLTCQSVEVVCPYTQPPHWRNYLPLFTANNVSGISLHLQKKQYFRDFSPLTTNNISESYLPLQFGHLHGGILPYLKKKWQLFRNKVKLELFQIWTYLLSLLHHCTTILDLRRLL